jgi:hypothetical protein
MYQFCFTVNGHRHCFDVPTLIDQHLIRVPPPNNYPPFELAVSVLMLVDAVPPSELSAELSKVAQRYIQHVAKGLPAGIELHPAVQTGHTAVVQQTTA